jgi:hypothetical protein
MIPAATTQVTSMEFVIANLPTWNTGAGRNGTPSCSSTGTSAAMVDAAKATLQSRVKIEISK